MGSSSAFTLACVSVLIWTVVAGTLFHFNDKSQLPINTITTIITFLSVFLIQHAQNHDTKAINEKLDEIIYSLDVADNRFVRIEQEEETVLEELDELHK